MVKKIGQYDYTNISGLVGWFDGNDSSYMEFDEDERLAVWKDKSNSRNDLIQPVASRRPYYKGTINDLNNCYVGEPDDEIGVRTEAPDIWMYNKGKGFDFTDRQINFFVVVTVSEFEDVWKTILSLQWYNQGLSVMLEGTEWHTYQKSSKDYIWGESPLIDNGSEDRKVLLTYSSENIATGTATLEINFLEDQITIAGTPIQNVYGRLYLNSTEIASWCGGFIYHELVFFNRILEHHEKILVQGTLAWKWHLEYKLPDGHPYKYVYNITPPVPPPTVPGFSSTWKTNNTGSSNDNQIMLPLTNTGTYNFVVEWGDGSSDTITSYTQPEVIHTYSTPGTYNVTMNGVITGFRFNNGGDAEKIIDISEFLALTIIDNAAFYGCANLNISATDAPTIAGGDLSYMFRGCSLLTNINPDEWDTSSVTNMSYMFNSCSKFNQQVSSLNTSNVIDMSNMFYSCLLFNQSLSFDTAKVENMAAMFRNCYVFNQPLSFDTSSVEDMGGMFHTCWEFNQPLSFDTSSVEDMESMFYNCNEFNQALTFNTVNVIDMSNMFYSCTSFNQPINFNTINVTNMENMFTACFTFRQDLGGLNITSLTNAAEMLRPCNIDRENYDKLLIGWAAQTEQPNVTLNVNNLTNYSAGAPATARASLVANGWTITDDGPWGTYGSY